MYYNKNTKKKTNKIFAKYKENYMLPRKLKVFKKKKRYVLYSWTVIIHKAVCQISPKLTYKFTAI